VSAQKIYQAEFIHSSPEAKAETNGGVVPIGFIIHGTGKENPCNIEQNGAKDDSCVILPEQPHEPIKSKIKEILKELWKKPNFVFNKMFTLKKRSKVEVVTAFLSLLELSKMSRIEVTQDSLFGDINVTKLKKNRSD
jgi:hypothetical protein